MNEEGILIRDYKEIEELSFRNSKDVVNRALQNLEIPGTTIIWTQSDANKAVSILENHKGRIHAWDTETIGIDPKIESPVGKG